MGEPPDKIYLQWFGVDDDTFDTDIYDGVKQEEVTWCEDKIFNTDIEYIRVLKKTDD